MGAQEQNSVSPSRAPRTPLLREDLLCRPGGQQWWGAGGWAGLAGPEEPLTRDCVPRWFRRRLTEGLPALGFGSQQFLGVSLLN